MKKLLAVGSAILLFVACSDNSTPQKKVEQTTQPQIAQSNSDENSVEAKTEDKPPDPIDYEKAVETWNEEVDEWYRTSGMGAIEVSPMEDDYSFLNVTVHNNLKPLDEEGRLFISDHIEKDLQNLVDEIFKTDTEIQVEIKFQDGSPLLDE